MLLLQLKYSLCSGGLDRGSVSGDKPTALPRCLSSGFCRWMPRGQATASCEAFEPAVRKRKIKVNALKVQRVSRTGTASPADRSGAPARVSARSCVTTEPKATVPAANGGPELGTLPPGISSPHRGLGRDFGWLVGKSGRSG